MKTNSPPSTGKRKQRKGLAAVSRSRKEKIRQRSVTARQPEAAKAEPPVAPLRTVCYEDPELNQAVDDTYTVADRVVAFAESKDGPHPLNNLISAISTVFGGLAGWANDRGIGLADFLVVIEHEANVIIQETNLLHQHEPKETQ
jgi:hypothetical protein